MTNKWNKNGFFSGITEDYSNYRWYKGEKDNPYQGNDKQPLAASFWIYERDFHLSYLDDMDTSNPLEKAYQGWKEQLLKEHLPSKAPNPNGDTTDWERVFDSGLMTLA